MQRLLSLSSDLLPWHGLCRVSCYVERLLQFMFVLVYLYGTATWCSHTSPPPLQGGGCFRSYSSSSIEATVCPMQVNFQVRVFDQYPVEPHLLPPGTEAMSTLGAMHAPYTFLSSWPRVSSMPGCESPLPFYLAHGQLPTVLHQSCKAARRLKFCSKD